jgi:hypothetical protein
MSQSTKMSPLAGNSGSKAASASVAAAEISRCLDTSGRGNAAVEGLGSFGAEPEGVQKRTTEPFPVPMPTISLEVILGLGRGRMRLAEISERTGVARSTVESVLVRHGITVVRVPPGGRVGKRIFDWGAARAAYDRGERVIDIARRLGVAESSIRHAINSSAAA